MTACLLPPLQRCKEHFVNCFYPAAVSQAPGGAGSGTGVHLEKEQAHLLIKK